MLLNIGRHLSFLLFSTKAKDSIMRGGCVAVCHEPQTLFVRLDIWGAEVFVRKMKKKLFPDKASISSMASLDTAIQ